MIAKISHLKERYSGEWRHAYKSNDDTQVMMQISKLTDDDFFHEYFERRFENGTDLFGGGTPQIQIPLKLAAFLGNDARRRP